MLALFFTDYKHLCFHSRKSICTESDRVWFALCYSKADDSSLMQLCHEESRSAVLHNFCSTERSPALDLVCLSVYVYKNTWMHHLTPVYSNIYLGCLTAFRLSFISKSMNLNSLTVVSPCVMQQHFCCNCSIFLRSSIWPDEKCKQTGYVTECRVSGGLVIGLKTEPHWECDLTQTCATFV